VPLPKLTPLGALRLPRIARNRGSLHLPYLEIKLTFECTADFMVWRRHFRNKKSFRGGVEVGSSVKFTVIVSRVLFNFI